jgi:hypothetical protein
MIRAAQLELVALAVAVRDDWAEADVQAALLAARNAGWTWSHALRELARLMTTEDAGPRDLVAAVSAYKPGAPGRGTEPNPEYLAVKQTLGGHDDAA